MKEDNKSIIILVPTKLDDALKKIAEDQMMSKSDIVRSAILEVIRKNEIQI